MWRFETDQTKIKFEDTDQFTLNDKLISYIFLNYVMEGLYFEYDPDSGSYVLYSETSPVESDITALAPQMDLMEDSLTVATTNILFHSDGTITNDPQIEKLSLYGYWSISDDKLTLTLKRNP